LCLRGEQELTMIHDRVTENTEDAQIRFSISLFTFLTYHLRRMKPLLVIVNNAAAKARHAWPSIKDQLLANGIEFDFHETTHAGDATAKTQAALNAGVTTIAAVGGDGTLSEAAQGFFQFAENPEQLPALINPAASLAILPAGTGDDFARGLMGRRETLGYWINVLVTHCRTNKAATIRQTDVLYGACNNYRTPFICINASTMGIGGETAGRVARQGKLMRSFSGEARFAAVAASPLACREGAPTSRRRACAPPSRRRP